MQILIIDDEDDIREVAQASLEMTIGATVHAVASGAEGVAAAAALQPDVILLDVMMPGMDGPTTLRALQAAQETRPIPVVFLTAKVQAADRRRFVEMGVRGLISKPFDPLRLGAEVELLLRQSP